MTENNHLKPIAPCMILALFLMILGAVFGCLAGLEYVIPGYIKPYINFSQLRPMHVSAVLFWILLGANASVYAALSQLIPGVFSKLWMRIQWILWCIAIVGIFASYAGSRFGGREYWEFHPVWAIPIALSWVIFVVQVINAIRQIRPWPVYVWMWMTGSVFFLWIFAENYFWFITGLREKAIVDMMVQWKVNGSIVGAWNQLIYGTAFYLMDRIQGQNTVGRSRLAFAMYFLGLFNLMFNWGHHLYTLPGITKVRYIGYIVSMTEWVFFAKIIHEWKISLSEAIDYYHLNSYKFIMASKLWLFFNMFTAILMSIPVLNLYTHGTHVTVAHAMGTTIGINTMILLGASFSFVQDDKKRTKEKTCLFWLLQISLLVFVLALLGAGICKGMWQMSDTSMSFNVMMRSLQPYFKMFLGTGFALLFCLLLIGSHLIKRWFALLTKDA